MSASLPQQEARIDASLAGLTPILVGQSFLCLVVIELNL